MGEAYDVIVIGAGIAGASVAAELAKHQRVLILEREEQPGYHSTGRSAAAFIPSYGASNPALRILTACSKPFYDDPGDGFCESPLLHVRGLLTLFEGEGCENALDEYLALNAQLPGAVTEIESVEVRQRLPLIRDNWSQGAWFEPGVADIDVHSLHQAYLRAAAAEGADRTERAEVMGIDYRRGLWSVNTTRGSFSAARIVNAAGAWADSIAEMAGVEPLGLQPLRRTAVLLRPPESVDVGNWPLAYAHDDSFYVKPDAGMLLVSPADEHPSQPCDAQPEEIDIAYAVHFIEQALDISVSNVEHSWAGLRTFAADRTPVIGEDPTVSGFFWVAGQGGHGIQIAPAAARLAAALFEGQPVPPDLAEAGFEKHWVGVERFDKSRAHHRSAQTY